MAREYPFYCAGEWRTSSDRLEIRNPYNDELVGVTYNATDQDLEDAIVAAQRAFEVTRKLQGYERAEILQRMADGLRKRQEEIARLIAMEAGKPIRDARVEAARGVFTLQTAVEEAKRIGGETIPLDLMPYSQGRFGITRRFPIGPIAGISPFNFPLNLVAHKLSPAFAAGNPVVLKPPMQAPVTSLKLAEIAFEAGLPPRALSVVHSVPEVAERLATDERFRLLSFTGSARVGWHLKSIAGRKKVLLELGSTNPAIVHEDADLGWAVERCVSGAFAMNGQNCIRIQRLLVHRPVYDEFVGRLVEATGRVKVGNPLEDDTVVGPVIDSAAADRIAAWIEEAVAGGARVLAGGGRRGNVIEPTILAGTRPEMKVEREEIFGPAMTVRPYDDFAEALALANDSEYGLQAGVFTQDIRRIWQAYEALEVGGVVVNDHPMLRVDNYPFGGVKKSGLGREGVRFAYEEMTELKALVVRVRG